jgi:colanic acid/amylovoran biosynthesis glycosyltransferase
MRAVAFLSLDVGELPDGRVELTQKFVDGMRAMARGWPGEMVAVLAPRGGVRDTNLDQKPWHRHELPFTLVIKDPRDPDVARTLEGAAVAIISTDFRHVDVAHAAHAAGVPYVMVAEYSLRTRLQIAAVEEEHVDKRARRMIWETLEEARQRKVVSGAAGLQCNGTPIYDSWSKLNKHPILYFDTRVTKDMLAGADDADRRGRARELQLAFSGRLITMKGVMHLVDIARALRELGTRFQLHVFGDGPLKDPMQDRIVDAGLERHVLMEGVLPFPELMKKLRDDIDLFVCPHVQGDPSCTYLETLSCGVPIAGYANDAWKGLCKRSESGFASPLGDARALAALIAELDRSRDNLRAAAAQAVRFASAHTFELTFARRLAHVRRIAGVD